MTSRYICSISLMRDPAKMLSHERNGCCCRLRRAYAEFRSCETPQKCCRTSEMAVVVGSVEPTPSFAHARPRKNAVARAKWLLLSAPSSLRRVSLMRDPAKMLSHERNGCCCRLRRAYAEFR